MSRISRLLLILSLITLACAGCEPAKGRSPSTPTLLPAPLPASPTITLVPPLPLIKPTATRQPQNIPFELVSEESLFGYLESITSIQPYSGWRNSGSSGEAEALDYVEGILRHFDRLQAMGLELERQSFPVYMATEIRESRLFLTTHGSEIEVLADGIRGNRSMRPLAAYIDSDGNLYDSDPNPFTTDGAPLVVHNTDQLYSLLPEDVTGRVLFFDYALVDTATNEDYEPNYERVMQVLDQGPVGLVFVTQYSNKDGESRGTLMAEGAIFNAAVPKTRMPILYVHLEDLRPAGITSWEDLQKIESARLLVDIEVNCPGKAGNLIARIPGMDTSKAVILGAHIDSPNSPGAFDDGSGSAALLEVARVFDVSEIQPPVDVYLAWFGGHEIGTYGSGHFVATHQELLDRTLAEIQIDGLGHPLDGRPASISFIAGSYDQYGEDPWSMPGFLIDAVASQGLEIETMVENSPIADNTNFDGSNVPNVYLGFTNVNDWRMKGSTYFHFASHWHDTYETASLAREVAAGYVGMTKILLAAALEIGRLGGDFRVTPAYTGRALIVSTHNESNAMVTSMLRDLGMALSWEGFNVDMVPYGQTITPQDLKDVGVIVLPPTMDFPGPHNEVWSEAELALLQDYLAKGGFLVVTNSSCTYAIKRCTDDPNEDTKALNAFLEPLGVRFMLGWGPPDNIALAVAEHPLTANATYLNYYRYEGVPFKLTQGLELVRASAKPVVALLDYGNKGGQVLVIADLGILQLDKKGAKNLDFLKNIARYARQH